jgi:hypothetical protein
MGGQGYCTALSRNKKEPGAFSMQRDLPGGGVYDCTTYGAWGQTSWFLPVNSLFPPHKTSKTAASVIRAGIHSGIGFWRRYLSGHLYRLVADHVSSLFHEKTNASIISSLSHLEKNTIWNMLIFQKELEISSEGLAILTLHITRLPR